MRLLLLYVVWWIALFWLWLAYQGEWNRIEWVAAAGSATLGAALLTAIVALGLLRYRIPLASITAAARVPLQIVIDFGIVTGALAQRLAGRRVAGQFVVRPFSTGRGREAVAGDRAWREVAATYSPNAYVIDVDAGTRTVLLHDLVPHRSSEEPA